MDFTVTLRDQESHREWAFPCLWSPITLPWLGLMGLWLVGEVPRVLIDNVFFQIQGWVTAVSCELERIGDTDSQNREAERSLMDIHESKYPEGKESNIWGKIGEIWVGWGGREKAKSAVVKPRRCFWSLVICSTLFATEPEYQARLKTDLSLCFFGHTVDSGYLSQPLEVVLFFTSNLFYPFGEHEKMYSSPLCICSCCFNLSFTSLDQWGEWRSYFFPSGLNTKVSYHQLILITTPFLVEPSSKLSS